MGLFASQTWEVSHLAACKSSARLGGKGRHICNRICGNFPPLWRKNKQKLDELLKSNRRKEWNKGSCLRSLFDDPRLLQQVFRYLGPNNRSCRRELHLQVLAEATGVIIDCRASVSKGLDERVNLQNLLTECPIVCLKIIISWTLVDF